MERRSIGIEPGCRDLCRRCYILMVKGEGESLELHSVDQGWLHVSSGGVDLPLTLCSVPAHSNFLDLLMCCGLCGSEPTETDIGSPPRWLRQGVDPGRCVAGIVDRVYDLRDYKHRCMPPTSPQSASDLAG